jgi:hypothetical protein
VYALAGGGLGHLPILKRNLEKVIACLVSPVDIARAKLDAIKNRIEAQGETEIRRAVAEERAWEKQLAADPEMRKRAAERFESRLLREQANSEQVFRQALLELREVPSQDASAEIDDDWLHFFARAAEGRSNPYFQALYGKILSGEIQRPGSFRPATIDTLMKLTRDVALLFQSFADASVFIPSDGPPRLLPGPMGSPGLNELQSAGLMYDDLCRLETSGLIHYDQGAYTAIAPQALISPLSLGGEEMRFAGPISENAPAEIHAAIVAFTDVGLEIRSVMTLGTNAPYREAFLSWMKGFGLDLVRTG